MSRMKLDCCKQSGTHQVSDNLRCKAWFRRITCQAINTFTLVLYVTADYNFMSTWCRCISKHLLTALLFSLSHVCAMQAFDQIHV